MGRTRQGSQREKWPAKTCVGEWSRESAVYPFRVRPSGCRVVIVGPGRSRNTHIDTVTESYSGCMRSHAARDMADFDGVCDPEACLCCLLPCAVFANLPALRFVYISDDCKRHHRPAATPTHNSDISIHYSTISDARTPTIPKRRENNDDTATKTRNWAGEKDGRFRVDNAPFAFRSSASEREPLRPRRRRHMLIYVSA